MTKKAPTVVVRCLATVKTANESRVPEAEVDRLDVPVAVAVAVHVEALIATVNTALDPDHDHVVRTEDHVIQDPDHDHIRATEVVLVVPLTDVVEILETVNILSRIVASVYLGSAYTPPNAKYAIYSLNMAHWKAFR